MTRRKPRDTHLSKVIICLILAGAVLAAYWQVSGYDFINFDDPTYVVDNRMIRQGITLEGVKWAFSSVYASNWHPLTWVSHMLDVELFGLDPGKHHLTNVFFHMLNSVLLFLVLFGMTGMQWRSAVVAALFALHPLHVESVAWVSERKDVLSSFFWILTMAVYLWYIKDQTITRYLVTVFAYIFGLLSKPMLVTLPFVLILLDYWPLDRITRPMEAGKEGWDSFLSGINWPKIPLILIEKVPLIIIAAASSSITVYAQKSGGAMQPFEHLQLGTRVLNSIASYVSYLWKAVWPSGLAVFYPYPDRFQPAVVVLCSIFLLLSTILVLIFARRNQYLPVGWFWYLGTLLPVIGLVQVGSQSMADRYTYLPLIGIFIMAVWGFGDLLSKIHLGKAASVTASAGTLLLFSVITWNQVGFWKDSITLFKHALDVTRNNDLAHFNLGHALEERGDINGAIRNYQATIQISPYDVPALTSLGAMLLDLGKMEEAKKYLQEALRINPMYTKAVGTLGNLMLRTGEVDQAIKSYHEVLRIDPLDAEVNNNLGAAYSKKGNLRIGVRYFQEAIRLNPENKDALQNLRKARDLLKKIEVDIAKVEELIKTNPRNPQLYIKLAELKTQHGDTNEAISCYYKVLSIQSGSIQALYNLAHIYSEQQDYSKALQLLDILKKLRPDAPDVYYNIACIYAKQDNVDEALLWLKRAVDKGFKDFNLIKNDKDLINIRNTERYRDLIDYLQKLEHNNKEGMSIPEMIFKPTTNFCCEASQIVSGMKE
jgi:protein O-mannosyl-transferase